MLEGLAFQAYQTLCESWARDDVTNTDAYRLRTLAILAEEERQEALEPLYSHICAGCGQLLGLDIGADIFYTKPWQVRGKECSVNSQPPFLLLWHPATYAREVPWVFDYDEDSLGHLPGTGSLKIKQQWWESNKSPPWVRNGSRKGTRGWSE